MVIDGKRHTRDVIVFPEGVLDGWWRKEGHRLFVEDLKEIIEHVPKPEVLVVGTGYYGRVKAAAEVDRTLKANGIDLYVQSTMKAVQTFNKLLKSGKRVAGAFHLTC